jgi:hypothetical protein
VDRELGSCRSGRGSNKLLLGNALRRSPGWYLLSCAPCRGKSLDGERAQCSRSRSGSKSSACPNTPSALPKTALIGRFFLTMTDQDLEKMGVILGDRRKMLRAIASLETGKSAAAVAAAAPAKPSPQDTAERRQVTVMFSDLVGSTALSGRMRSAARSPQRTSDRPK